MMLIYKDDILEKIEKAEEFHQLPHVFSYLDYMQIIGAYNRKVALIEKIEKEKEEKKHTERKRKIYEYFQEKLDLGESKASMIRKYGIAPNTLNEIFIRGERAYISKNISEAIYEKIEENLYYSE